MSLRELAALIVTNPKLQRRLLDQARAGTLSPRLMIELFHYCGGKPPDRVEIPKPPPNHAEVKARLARLSLEERRQYADLLIKMEQPAQPAPAVRPNLATGKSI